MHDFVVNFLQTGLAHAARWQIVLYVLVMTHITIASVTIFLHRAQAHRALELGPVPSHFFRFWLWLTTGMVTKDWVAIHRKHHAKCETPDDPHSPQTRGLKMVLLQGSELYREAAAMMPVRLYLGSGSELNQGKTELEHYGQGTPDDWLEQKLYSRFIYLGVSLMLVIDFLLFGAIGATVWAVQMLWIPVTAAGIINGLGHYWGYRNFEPPDASTNIVPWGIVIGGEELHNNHHAYPTSARLSAHWYEFDIGWLYIRLLQLVGQAHVKHEIPRLWVDHQADPCTTEALQAIQRANLHVMARFNRLIERWKELPEDRERLRFRLMALWQSNENKERLLELFREWCRDAERIPKLRQFAWRLARFRLKT